MKATVGRMSSGMTLLEVMIALLLLCVGIMAVAAMLNVSMRSNANAHSGVLDTLAAAVMMERILALPYDDPNLEDRDDGFIPQDPDHGPIDLMGRSSTIEWEVDREFPTHNAKRVLITVRKKGDPNTDRGYRFEYVKSKNYTFFSAGVGIE